LKGRKERWKEEEEDVSGYWMAFGIQEGTGIFICVIPVVCVTSRWGVV
jgi:hypothetical protein